MGLRYLKLNCRYLNPTLCIGALHVVAKIWGTWGMITHPHVAEYRKDAYSRTFLVPLIGDIWSLIVGT